MLIDIEANKNPIGFFDSGVGGISVLREALKIMPEENYIYYGDSINAPYGEKDLNKVRNLTEEAVDVLVGKNCKAVVIACNTATSASIEDIRRKYKNIPIIGIEPAIKPAIENNRGGEILIMATPITLRETKFVKLLQKYVDKHTIELLPCPGLADLIEEGKINHEDTKKYLHEYLDPYRSKKIEQVVLGCTHYPFIENQIRAILGEYIEIIHGGEGTVKQLKRRLIQMELKNSMKQKGQVEILNSKNEQLCKLCRSLLEL